jgi:hypothetical protein
MFIDLVRADVIYMLISDFSNEELVCMIMLGKLSNQMLDGIDYQIVANMIGFSHYAWIMTS